MVLYVHLYVYDCMQLCARMGIWILCSCARSRVGLVKCKADVVAEVAGAIEAFGEFQPLVWISGDQRVGYALAGGAMSRATTSSKRCCSRSAYL